MTPTDEQYNDILTKLHDNIGGLPVTGYDVWAVVCISAILVCVGFLMHRAVARSRA
jgi:hypothetical protein